MGTRRQSNTTPLLGLLHSLKAEGVYVLLIKGTFLSTHCLAPSNIRTDELSQIKGLFSPASPL